MLHREDFHLLLLLDVKQVMLALEVLELVELNKASLDHVLFIGVIHVLAGSMPGVLCHVEHVHHFAAHDLLGFCHDFVLLGRIVKV